MGWISNNEWVYGFIIVAIVAIGVLAMCLRSAERGQHGQPDE